MNQLEPIDPKPIQPEGAQLLAVISRAASDPSVDVEKMERLMEVYRGIKAQESETDFNQAMARVQANMGRIGTDKRNRQTNSDYATYGKLDRALRPLYTAEGFALSFGTDPVEIESMVRVTCHVTHKGGYTRKYLIDMPSDGKGAKGNDVMTKTHATGSATQYGMRYLLKMIFNVAIGEEDDDGNGASQESPKDANWIRVAEALEDPSDYETKRAELLEDYGNVSSIPKQVREAFSFAKARVTPKDEE